MTRRKPKQIPVVVIGGGETFDDYKSYLSFLKKDIAWNPYQVKKPNWKDNLQKDLGRNFFVYQPRMPNPLNAKYLEWEIFFKGRVEPHLRNDVILVGHSLGGLFLLKYLETHRLPFNVKATFLVATPFNVYEDGVGFADFFLQSEWARIAKRAGKITIIQAEDDWIVPTVDAKMYRAAFPKATLVIQKKGGHFIWDRKIPVLLKGILGK